MTADPTAAASPALEAAEDFSRRLIRFENIAQFEERPLYRRGVDAKAHTLVRPIGGYSFDRGGYTCCGLTGCNREHGLGLVLLLSGDVETNIGHCCGTKKYGLQWEELGIRLESIRRAYAVKDLSDRITRDRTRLLAKANELRGQLAAAKEAIAPIAELLESDHALMAAFANCVKASGELFYFRELSADERAMSPGQRNVQERLGSIDGYEALSDDDLPAELKAKVLAPLWAWQELDMTKAKKKQLDEIAGRMRELEDVLRRAASFIESAARLVKRSNWDAFSRYVLANGVHASHRSKEKLRELAGLPARRY